MDREVTGVLGLSTTIIMIAALLGLVIVTVVLGHNVRTSAVGNVVAVRNDLSQGFIRDMVNKENDMPAAAAYSVLKTYRNLIPVLICRVTHTTTNIALVPIPLSRNLRGRVSLQVVRPTADTYTGTYTVTVHRQGCNWFRGVCTCI